MLRIKYRLLNKYFYFCIKDKNIRKFYVNKNKAVYCVYCGIYLIYA